MYGDISSLTIRVTYHRTLNKEFEIVGFCRSKWTFFLDVGEMGDSRYIKVTHDPSKRSLFSGKTVKR